MAADCWQMRFGLVSEIHFAPLGTPPTAWHNPFSPDQGLDLLHLAVEKLRASAIDRCVLLGDLSHLGDRASIRRVADALSPLGVECWLLPGNHDVDSAPDGLARFDQAVEGSGNIAAPANSIPIQGGTAHLVALERNVDSNGFSSVGFLEHVTSDAGIVLLFSHFPILPMAETFEASNLKHAGDLTDRAALDARLTARVAPTVVVHGHLHVRASLIAGSVLHLSCAALIEPPHEVAILTITYDERSRLVVQREAHQVREVELPLPILSPAVERWRFDRRKWLLIATPRD